MMLRVEAEIGSRLNRDLIPRLLASKNIYTAGL
jgi:hypothetical protein